MIIKVENQVVISGDDLPLFERFLQYVKDCYEGDNDHVPTIILDEQEQAFIKSALDELRK